MENEKQNKGLEEGEQYLNIKLTGHNYVAAFKNKDKTNSNQPDYKGDGVAVWITKKKSATPINQVEAVTVGNVETEKVEV